MSGGIPDLSGTYDADLHGPEGTRVNTWDSSDPFAKHPEQAPMTPWAAEKFKDVRPPFGALQTFNNTNDPVQRYCDPPGVPRIYMYPWEMKFIQTPKAVYILYEYTKVWREIDLDRDHPKDPDNYLDGRFDGKVRGRHICHRHDRLQRQDLAGSNGASAQRRAPRHRAHSAGWTTIGWNFPSRSTIQRLTRKLCLIRKCTS